MSTPQSSRVVSPATVAAASNAKDRMTFVEDVFEYLRQTNDMEIVETTAIAVLEDKGILRTEEGIISPEALRLSGNWLKPRLNRIKDKERKQKSRQIRKERLVRVEGRLHEYVEEHRDTAQAAFEADVEEFEETRVATLDGVEKTEKKTFDEYVAKRTSDFEADMAERKRTFDESVETDKASFATDVEARKGVCDQDIVAFKAKARTTLEAEDAAMVGRLDRHKKKAKIDTEHLVLLGEVEFDPTNLDNDLPVVAGGSGDEESEEDVETDEDTE